MADEIKPIQPTMPSPLVTPLPEDKRHQKNKPQQDDTEEKTEKSSPEDEDKGGQIDEYV